MESISLDDMKEVVKELRSKGVRALIWKGPGGPDIYILEDDAELLNKLCDEKKLSDKAYKLMC